jgi:hypothetical protein
MFPFYIIFALASIGLFSLLDRWEDRNERMMWLAALLAVAAYGFIDEKLAVYYGAGVFLVALLAILVIHGQTPKSSAATATSLLILLAAGVVIRGNFPSPKTFRLGVEAKEQASVYLQEHLAPGTKVAAGSPGVVWASNMTYSGMASKDVPIYKTSEEFLDWMVRQNIEAVYVDHSLYNTNPAVWNLLKPRIGEELDRVFVADEGDIQVLLVQPD